jgi:hypothetical protein
MGCPSINQRYVIESSLCSLVCSDKITREPFHPIKAFVPHSKSTNLPWEQSRAHQKMICLSVLRSTAVKRENSVQLNLTNLCGKRGTCFAS